MLIAALGLGYMRRKFRFVTFITLVAIRRIELDLQRTQIRNELTVERIVRNRSLEGMIFAVYKNIFIDRSVAFKSRCKYFEPPLNDHEARKWWDAAKAR